MQLMTFLAYRVLLSLVLAACADPRGEVRMGDGPELRPSGTMSLNATWIGPAPVSGPAASVEVRAPTPVASSSGSAAEDRPGTGQPPPPPPAPAPAPGLMFLFGGALLATGLVRRRRRQQPAAQPARVPAA